MLDSSCEQLVKGLARKDDLHVKGSEGSRAGIWRGSTVQVEVKDAPDH